MAKHLTLIDAVKGYLLHCKATCSHRTIEWYRQKLAHFCTVLHQEYEIVYLKDVTVMHMRLFVGYMQDTKANSNNPHKPTRDDTTIRDITVKGYVQCIKGFFAWCCREELLKKNPGVLLDNPKVSRYVIPTLTQEQITSLLSVCDTRTAIGFRDYTIILLLLDTGVRVSEMCTLTLDRVSLAVLNDAFVTVMGKGRKEREVGISPDVAQCLWKYIHVYRHPKHADNPSLFMNVCGASFTPAGVEEMLRAVAKRAQLTALRVSPHVFRHTFARMFLEHGGDVYKLSVLLGHSSVVVTEHYLKDFSSRNARKGHATYSPVANMQVHRAQRGFRKGAPGILNE